MSIKFRMYQDNRKNSKRKGYWYARAVSPDLVSVKDLALRISERCTVTEPDILAVISALVFEMNQVLKDGNRVKLDGLGTFRVGIHSQGVQKAEDFNAQRDIYGAHVLFSPTVTIDAVCVFRRLCSMMRLRLPRRRRTRARRRRTSLLLVQSQVRLLPLLRATHSRMV